jgi:hypothetical protein
MNRITIKTDKREPRDTRKVLRSMGADWRSIATVLLAVAALALSGPLAMAAPEQRVFETPEAAVDALLEALANDDDTALLDIFGHEHRDLVVGADKAAVREERRQAYDAAQEMWTLSPEAEDRTVVVIGPNAWPLPIPLVKENPGWRFDTEVGKEEILNRRIGRNELEAIELCEAYVDAQLEYASRDRDGDEVLEYGQRLLSSEGKKDGLYWPANAAASEELSPFGPLVADARAYLEGKNPGDPYRGYYFKILTGQGPNPPGGAYDYVINGNMIAGFALIAFPADYGTSGVMTFKCSHQGRIYEKDLGEATKVMAEKIEVYDPDETWTEFVED